MAEKQYKCEDCEHTLSISDGDSTPNCCGKEMILIPLEECMKAPADPEHARFGDEDEPCDDGRSG